MKKLALFIMLLIVFNSSIVAQDNEAEVNDLDPEMIDPFSENVGDFLDVELSEYRMRAFELYNEQKYEEAAKYYLSVLRFDINDNISLYNLACCYGLLGKEKLAAEFLIRSVRAGYDDIEHIKRDPDFDQVRGRVVFDAAVDSIAQVIAKKEKEKGNVIYNTAAVLLKCRIHLPENYDPESQYTLIVGLHGYGSSPDRFITLWKRFGDDKFIYASPQAPYPFAVGTEVGYSWGIWHNNDAISTVSGELSEEYVCQVVSSICMSYNIDKVYLMGFSQGCALTYSTGIKNHHLFKGLICFGGWLDTDWISEQDIANANTLRVFIGHGKDDTSVKFEAGEKAQTILKENEYSVAFESFEGGHAVPEEIMKKAITWIDEETQK